MAQVRGPRDLPFEEVVLNALHRELQTWADSELPRLLRQKLRALIDEMDEE
jgi:hypothetical protein